MLGRSPMADRLLVAVTFLLTVFVDLVVAVNVGVVLAALVFMKRMSDSVDVEQQAFTDADAEGGIALPPDVLVYRVNGPFFFGAAEKLERTLERVPLGIRTVVLRLGLVPFVDATGLQTLTEVIQRFRSHGVRVLLCGVHPALRAALQEGEVLGIVGESDVCANMRDVAVRLAPNFH